jgi:hypothetical protein
MQFTALASLNMSSRVSVFCSCLFPVLIILLFLNRSQKDPIIPGQNNILVGTKMQKISQPVTLNSPLIQPENLSIST